MAADHRRKRLNGASIVDFSSREQYRSKKKKLELAKHDLTAKSHVVLEWDGNQKKVVAKRGQIGISQRDLRPFIDNFPQCQNIVADVLAVPCEIFELENLTDVLSFEVWQSNLSENERSLLMQFLPRGPDAAEVVQALLTGDNFHFGNPFLKWGASVCSGNSHPDAVLRQEKCLKAEKKAYYSEIQEYHSDMIKNLLQLKEMWESSEDPEREVLQNIWRSRRDAERRISSHANDSRFRNLEENVVATSESCSLVAEEKACSSDNQNSSVMKGGKLQKRIYEEGLMKDKGIKPLVASNDAKLGKGEKLCKHNITHSDGAKYMSYLKISKKQHELVMSMKQSGKSIQSKSLNRVLGNLDTLHVQPYEEFVKEEQKKLKEHWLQLANKDLPAVYANWRGRQFQRREITESLEQELKDNLKSSMEDEEKEKYATVHQVQNDQGLRKHECHVEDEEREIHDTVLQVQIDQEERECESNVEEEDQENQETLPQDQNDQLARDQEPDVEDDQDSDSGSPQYQSPQQISSLSGGHDLNPIDMDLEDNHVASSPDLSQYSGNANTADASISQGVPVSSGGDVWSAVSMPHSYYDSAVNHDYPSTSGLPLPHHVNEEQQTQMIDLEAEVHVEDTGKDLLHGQSDGSSFSSYPNNERTGLLQSLFKGPGILSYHHEQRQTGLDFESPNNMLMEDGQFTGHLQGQLQPSLPMGQGQKRHSEGYIQQNIPEDIYTGRGGYLIPRQEHLPPVNMQDWAANPGCVSARLQSHLNDDGLLTQNWFSGERQVRVGWTGSDGVGIPCQSMGSNADQSLFSVLSQCNQLRSSGPFDSMGSNGQFVLPRNYGMMNGGTPRISNALPQAGLPLDYLNACDTASSLMPDDMGWMNLPHNSALHDPMGKSYLRSWNQ